MSELQDTWVEEIDELPPRPRRKLLTPLTGSLLAVLLLAGGFIGGVLVEKGQTSSAGAGGGGAARLLAAARAGSGAQGGFQGGSAPTFGQVTTVQGHTLYVTTAQGNTVKVKVPTGASVTRTVNGSVKNVHPGETVVVQGTKASDGSVTASSVQDTGTRGGGGAFGGFAGGGGGGGGASALNQLFGGGSK